MQGLLAPCTHFFDAGATRPLHPSPLFEKSGQKLPTKKLEYGLYLAVVGEFHRTIILVGVGVLDGPRPLAFPCQVAKRRERNE